MGKVIGYIRVSTIQQNCERQLNGVTLDKIFTDKASGKDTKRPQLIAMLAYVREGDEVVVHSLDRLARNLNDLQQLVEHLTAQQVNVSFIKESLTFTGEDSSMSKLLLSVMGAFSEFERSLLKERQAEGIAIAKKKGVYKGRKPKLSQDQVQNLKARVKKGEQKAQIARDLGISRETLYGYLKR